jgi:hypothetical protein
MVYLLLPYLDAKRRKRVERGKDGHAFYGTKKDGTCYREEWCERK